MAYVRSEQPARPPIALHEIKQAGRDLDRFDPMAHATSIADRMGVHAEHVPA
jgi:hypothetical protein